LDRLKLSLVIEVGRATTEAGFLIYLDLRNFAEDGFTTGNLGLLLFETTDVSAKWNYYSHAQGPLGQTIF
jgi:hypothetical protein